MVWLPKRGLDGKIVTFDAERIKLSRRMNLLSFLRTVLARHPVDKREVLANFIG